MPSNDTRDTDISHLHPLIRATAPQIVQRLNADGHPFAIFEAFRTPQRQAYLYAQGRTRPGPRVTNAPPWTSYHQYGLAVDFVLRINGQWSWSTSGQYAAAWDSLHQVGLAFGLEPLSWERPHLQVAGLQIADLRAGQYPPGGDESWAENLEGAIAGWSGSPAAPPAPNVVPARPPLEADTPDLEEGGLEALDIPAVGTSNWHRQFGGWEWRYDGTGIFVRDGASVSGPLRSPGSPITCRAIWETFGTIIVAMARKYTIAPEILIMTIATESAAYRLQGFTGPSTFRWEAHVWNRDVQPQTRGDYSAGPMQTLATTARWVIEAQSLPYHRFQVAPVYPVRPVPAPTSHPLYDPTTNIEIGAAEIRQRMGTTGTDPILIAAAFNSGGVYQSTDNRWHLRSYGNHLDRAAQWFGDACAVLREAGLR